MSYCKHCGKEVYHDAVVCVHCGRSLGYGEKPNDDGHIGWAFLGFFVPIIGLILYIVWKEERPKTAKRVGKGALISVILSAVMFLLVTILTMIASSFYMQVSEYIINYTIPLLI